MGRAVPGHFPGGPGQAGLQDGAGSAGPARGMDGPELGRAVLGPFDMPVNHRNFLSLFHHEPTRQNMTTEKVGWRGHVW